MVLKDELQGVEADSEDVQQHRKVLPDVLLVLEQNLAEQAEGHLWACEGLPPAAGTCSLIMSRTFMTGPVEQRSGCHQNTALGNTIVS